MLNENGESIGTQSCFTCLLKSDELGGVEICRTRLKYKAIQVEREIWNPTLDEVMSLPTVLEKYWKHIRLFRHEILT